MLHCSWNGRATVLAQPPLYLRQAGEQQPICSTSGRDEQACRHSYRARRFANTNSTPRSAASPYCGRGAVLYCDSELPAAAGCSLSPVLPPPATVPRNVFSRPKPASAPSASPPLSRGTPAASQRQVTADLGHSPPILALPSLSPALPIHSKEMPSDGHETAFQPSLRLDAAALEAVVPLPAVMPCPPVAGPCSTSQPINSGSSNSTVVSGVSKSTAQSSHVPLSSAAGSGFDKHHAMQTSSTVPQHLTHTEGTAPQAWVFKYKHLPCSSPCHPSDTRSLQLEALFQQVLHQPRLPARVYNLRRTITANMQRNVQTVEVLADCLGWELTSYVLRREPALIGQDPTVMLTRLDAARSMLDLPPSQVYMLLRKNPLLLGMDTSLVRERYGALHQSLPLSHENVRALVRKYPLILNYEADYVEGVVETLRQLSETRSIWQDNFETLRPSLLAFFFKLRSQLLPRLEYLALSGESPELSLREVFKPSTSMFAKAHSRYRPWLEARQAQQRKLQVRQAEAAQQRAAMSTTEATRRAANAPSRATGGHEPGRGIADAEPMHHTLGRLQQEGSMQPPDSSPTPRRHQQEVERRLRGRQRPHYSVQGAIGTWGEGQARNHGRQRQL